MEEKILFLPNVVVSHHHDTFYDGCIELLGSSSVFDYPNVPKYHSTHLVGDPYSWWCNNSNPNNLSIPLENWAILINRGEIKYIVGNNRAVQPFLQLLTMIDQERFKSIYTIFIEEEEDHDYSIHRNLLNTLRPYYSKIDLHLKVDFLANRVGPYKKIQPFYLSAPMKKFAKEVPEIKPFDQRTIDVCYITGDSHPDRKHIFNLLKNDLKIGNNIIEFGTHKYNMTQYFNVINDSKIAISVRGAGYSNTRNIENPILGTALFTQILDNTMSYEYQDGVSAVFYDKQTLIPKLNEYLNDPQKLKTLAENSYKHAIKYHTSKERAKQILELVQQLKEK